MTKNSFKNLVKHCGMPQLNRVNIFILGFFVLGFFGFTNNVNAAAITSAQSGNWSDTATWVGGVVPSVGDTFIISHDVDVDVDTTVGTSGSTDTQAGLVNDTKVLTVKSGVSFYVRGDLQLGGAAGGATVFKLEPGSSYYFDGSVSNVAYKIIIGGRHYSNPAIKVWTAGTSESRVNISSLGTSKGYFSMGGWVNSSVVDFNYTNFTDISSSSNLFMDTGFSMSSLGQVGRTVNVDHCIFDGCGIFKISSGDNNNNNIIHITNNNWKNSVDTILSVYLYGTNSDGNGNNIFQDNVCDKGVQTLRAQSFGTISGNIILRRFNNSYDSGPQVFSGNFLAAKMGNGTGDTDITNYDSSYITDLEINDNYFYFKDGSNIDVHSIQLGSGTGVANVTGNIWEAGSSNVTAYTNEGALLMVAGGSWTMNVLNNIVLRDNGNFGSGRLVAALPAAAGPYTFTLNINNNTGAYVTGPLIKTGETYPGHSGMFGSLKNNLVYGVGDVLRSVLANHSNGTKPAGALTDAVTKNNNIYNAYTGTNGIGYDAYNDVDTPIGTTDIHVNPNFFDDTRDLRTWDASLGGPGTETHALEELAKMNLSTWNSDYSVSNLLSYVRAGFTPTNMTLATAGEAGTYIGAVQPVDTTSPTMSAFTINSTATSTLSVTVNTLTATDNTAVTGYLINESASTPTAGDSGWSATAQTVYTAITQGIKTLYAWAKDAAGNISTSLNDTITIDTTSPTISEVTPVTTPANDTTPDYTFTTDEAGTITYGGDCSSLTTSATSGSNTITFETLSEATHSNCTIIVTDSVGNLSNTLSVTSFTIDTTNPTATLSPLDNATNVALSSTLSLTFSETVATSTGNLIIYKTTDDSIFETIDITSNQITTTDNLTYTITPTSNFAYQTQYYIQIDTTAFDDTAGNSYAGITDTTTWSFTTLPNPICPTISHASTYNAYPTCGVATCNTGYTLSSGTCILIGGGGIISTAGAGSINIPTPRQQTVYADGTIVYADEEGTGTNGTAGPSPTGTTGTPTSHTFTHTLSKPQESEEVTLLQQLLRQLGFFTHPTNTGYYGTITETAVKAFQCEYNIICEGTPESTGYGVVGPKTREALNNISSVSASLGEAVQVLEKPDGEQTEDPNSPNTEAQQVTQLQQQISDLLEMVRALQAQLLSL